MTTSTSASTPTSSTSSLATASTTTSAVTTTTATINTSTTSTSTTTPTTTITETTATTSTTTTTTVYNYYNHKQFLRMSYKCLSILENGGMSSAVFDVITDGSFEDVSSDSIGALGSTSGDWTVSGNAFFDQNSGTASDTPFGTKFVYFRGTSTVPVSRVSQNLTNLIPNTFYTLTYDYAVPFVDNPNSGPAFSTCSLTLQVGDSVNRDLVDVFGNTAQTAWAEAIPLDFVADCSELVFSLIWDCSQVLPGNEIDFVIDNVGFTGGQCVAESA
ncbi:hypothetical protein Z517_00525 [Fonsecaea pedrosoi CBS 271.37]|uniref:Uncharacterized protein n=1 Tax=Fonsecaea pedrosoi CBS 271.37 TaxID=1442368 RepID=A0A0D2E4X6_9EURO|nr:uncharacterized protein Z517_00525 [Fonsecaea pedrosoi CBS 271.37]KIW85136.1 hypothetical protein Z517_00525 [Fonsecaea pedrosoi CBS 271.37]